MAIRACIRQTFYPCKQCWVQKWDNFIYLIPYGAFVQDSPRKRSSHRRRCRIRGCLVKQILSCGCP